MSNNTWISWSQCEDIVRPTADFQVEQDVNNVQVPQQEHPSTKWTDEYELFSFGHSWFHHVCISFKSTSDSSNRKRLSSRPCKHDSCKSVKTEETERDLASEKENNMLRETSLSHCRSLHLEEGKVAKLKKKHSNLQDQHNILAQQLNQVQQTIRGIRSTNLYK